MTVGTGADTAQSGSGLGPRDVPPWELDKFRIPKDNKIVPDDPTIAEMQAAGVSRAVGSFKLCVDKTGAVTEVKRIKSTGFPAYDQKIQGQMERWKYAPITVDGKPVSLCTTTTFVYTPVKGEDQVIALEGRPPRSAVRIGGQGFARSAIGPSVALGLREERDQPVGRPRASRAARSARRRSCAATSRSRGRPGTRRT